MAARDAALHGAGSTPDHHSDEGEHHPGERTYTQVAIILAIVTAIEVAIYYIGFLEGVLVPLLIVLSIFKFIAVVGYFMHLKMDDRRLRILFVSALVLSLSVFLAVLTVFWTGSYFDGGLPAAGAEEGTPPAVPPGEETSSILRLVDAG